MNILMIEDNESVAEMMQMFFLNEGWEATFKYDGKEGLAAFLANFIHWGYFSFISFSSGLRISKFNFILVAAGPKCFTRPINK